MHESRVWVRKRKLKSGKTTHHLRWLDPASGCWRSRKIGTDSQHAQREAVLLERELSRGPYRDVCRMPWAEFVKEIVGYLSGGHAGEAEQVLSEFGTVVSPSSPSVAVCRSFGNDAHLRAMAARQGSFRCYHKQEVAIPAHGI